MACLIETLNLDIQVNILSHLPNIETLASLLKATPRLCPAFSSARGRILTKVLMNTYGADLYADALAATKIIMLPQESLDQSERLSFLSYYHHFRTLSRFPENDLPTSILMCQIHRALNYHVKLFSKRAIDFIISCAKGLCGEEVYYDMLQTYINSALSFTEQVRLRRGFLRFQIYSRLFCNADQSDEENRAHFSEGMPPWEAEEIASVHDYLIRCIRQSFDLAEEDFLSAYTTEVGLASTVGGIVGPTEEIFENGHDLYQARLKDHMLVSGLCSLRRLFESTGEARLALVSVKVDDSHFFKSPSMNSLLDSSLAIAWANLKDHERLYSSPGSSQLVSPDIKVDSIQKSTVTWRWAHAQNAYGDRRILIYHELRRWGYVFWDLRRMRYSGILKQR